MVLKSDEAAAGELPPRELGPGNGGRNRRSGRRRRDPCAILLVAIAFLSISLSTQSEILSWNDGSRVATIQALVEHGTFAIDATEYASIGDRVRIGGRYYSEKPPLLSLLGAAVYRPLYSAGVRVSPGGSGCYWITLLTVGVLWVAGLWAFYSALEYTSLRNSQRLLLTAALGLGSLHLPWATVLCNQSAAASCLILGFLFFLRTSPERERTPKVRRAVFWAGNFFALAAAFDLPTTVFYAAFLLIGWSDPRLRSSMWVALVPLLWTLIPTAAIHFAISGDIRPLFMDPARFDYPGSTFASTGGAMGATANDPSTALGQGWALLLGPRGLLWFNPLLLIGIPLLVASTRKRGPFRREARFVAICSAILVAYYTVFTDHLGGYGYGVRWLLPPVPLVHFFLYPVFQADTRSARLQRRAFWVLLAPATVLAMIGLRTPWIGLGSHLRSIADGLGLR